MTVIYIRSAGSKGYIRVGVEEEKKYDLTVSESEYREAGSPLTSDILTRDSFDILLNADMRYRARLRALRILSYGDNSDRRLVNKLVASGIKRSVAEETAREMQSLGYINNIRQIEKLVLNEVNLHMSGRKKIIPKLVMAGYKKSDIENVIDELISRGDIDFDSTKEKLISRLGDSADEDEIRKLLYKKGHI